MKGNRKGLTLLELLIASIIFVGFGTAITRLWISSGRQVRYAVHRALINREARIARAMILKDLSQTDSISEPLQSSINFYTVSGDTITYTYSSSEKKLFRYQTLLVSTTTAARHVSGFTASPSANNMLISYDFQKSSSSLELNIYFNKP